MNIILADNKKLLKKFINFPDVLYKNDENFVPYMKGDLLKTLTKLVLEEKTYKAVMAEDNGIISGRLLYTFGKNKQKPEIEKCGFMSMFECVNDQKTADAMLNFMCADLRKSGAKYLTCTYFPYDQDNRRGILAEGFDTPPVILTSYNPRYYNDLLVNFGMKKDFDTLAYKLIPYNSPVDAFTRIADKAMARFKFRVDKADFKNLDREIHDIGIIMQAATDENIYQEAPTVEALHTIVSEWKSFLSPEYALIARSTVDNRPLGVVVAVPDFNQVFKKMKGKINPVSIVKMLYYKKRINIVRGLLQYTIPEYQGKGVNLALQLALGKAAMKNKVAYFEASTIMENNFLSNEAIKSSGGFLYKRYRIYGMEL